jgi:type II secretion system protein H
MTSITGARSNTPRRAGFTLIELVLVMGLLTIVLAVAFPSLRNFFRGRHLDSEARRFLSLTRYAQSRAVSEGVPMVLWIDVQARTYGLEAQASYVEEDDKALEYVLEETLTFEVVMPRRVGTVSRSEAAATGNRPALLYSPDGFVSDSSPQRVVIRQGDEEEVWLAPAANRLNYEIQTPTH